MSSRSTLMISIAVTLGLMSLSSAAQFPMSTAFTYQGRLVKSGAPVNDNVDFEFALWDADVGGNQLGSTLTHHDVEVVDGLFDVLLDFGADPFDGDARWLEVAVRVPAGSGPYTTLSPRQELTPVPYAIFAETAGSLQPPVELSGATADAVCKVTNTGEGVAGQFECGSGGALYARAAGPAGQPAHFAIENANNAAGVLSAVTFGTGPVAYFSAQNAANNEPVFEAATTGTGPAAYFHLENAGSNATVLEASTIGRGRGAYFHVDNVSNNSDAMLAEVTNGSGSAVHGYTTGVGRAGHLEINRANNGSDALEVRSNGIGRVAYFRMDNTSNGTKAFEVYNNGRGAAAFFANWNSANDNNAVFAQTNGTGVCGSFVVNNTSNANAAVAGQTNGTGYAGMFSGGKGLYVTGSGTVLRAMGNVAIGLGPDATEKLDVNGTARLRSMPSGSGTTVVVDANGVLMRQSSSARYKKNVRPLEVDPAAPLALRPVRFDWKHSGQADIGLIAEEVAAVLPDLVVRDVAGRPDAVQYEKLSLYLLEVIQAQQKALDDLRERVAELEAAVDAE